MSSKSPKRRPTQAEQKASGNSRRNIVLASVVALIVAAVAVALITSGGDDKKAKSSGGGSSAVKGLTETKALFDGIDQNGATLGSAKAPVTMFEFIDYQCPFCRQFSLSTYPKIVDKAVREGKLKIVTRQLAFIGPDSERAARAGAAAGEQDKEHVFTQLFYWNQGQENSGYVTDAFIDKLYDAAGVDKVKANAYRKGAESRKGLDEGQRGAEQYGVVSTPTFVMGPSGGPYEKMELSIDDEAGFTTLIDELAKS